MYLPNYRDGSIVNLMQSILCGLGASGAGGAHGYLADLEPEEVARARHVVLVVIDGLGQAQLESGPAPALRASLRGTMTSVFPSTTASAVTTFLTGLAPVEHAVTGWFTWLRELDAIIAPLPFTTRAGRADLTALGVVPGDIFIGPSVFERVRADCHSVQPAHLVASAYSRAHTRGAEPRGFKRLDELVDAIVDIVRGARRRTYVSAYWPVLDTLSHKFGAVSARARAPRREDRHALRAPACGTRRKRRPARGDRGSRIRRHPPRVEPRCGIHSRSRTDALAPAVR